MKILFPRKTNVDVSKNIVVLVENNCTPFVIYHRFNRVLGSHGNEGYAASKKESLKAQLTVFSRKVREGGREGGREGEKVR